MDLCDIRTIKMILGRHGFHFSKGLGQNFLCDPTVPDAIARGAGLDENTAVLEVGPGIGTLTQQLCRHAAKVVAVELDRRLPALLKETMADHDNFTLVPGDILKTDIPALCREQFGDMPAVACANLPYYITTPAITTLIESRCFRSITVMVQKEVAQRICSQPGTADYGAFTVYINYHATAQTILNVPRDCFIPSPNVDSAVVRLDLLPQPPVDADEKMLFRVIKAAFAQRRKTLLNCLGMAFSDRMDKAALTEMLESCGVSPSARGETLSLQQFAMLADKLSK